MKILAIETSCDETGLAIVDIEQPDASAASITVLAESLLSQALLHAEYGGVYPSLAKREHSKNLGPLFVELLTQAGMLTQTQAPEISKDSIGVIKDLLEREPELFIHLATLLAQIEKPPLDAIAVTHGPGLEPALWVGVNFAKALSHAWNIPILPMNHMEGHLAAGLAQPLDDTHFTITQPKLPALALLLSGGHTELVLIKNWFDGTHTNSYEKIGSTRDDAVGEAFDKSARLLGIPYPGGPEISKLAAQARAGNLPQPYSLPRPMLATNDYDFSFSGLKTAVRNLVESIASPTDIQKKQIARELEDAITEVVVAKTMRAIDEFGVRSLIVGGGVSANAYIRTALTEALADYDGFTLYLPAPSLSTDNGLMIGFAAALHTIPTKTPTDLSANGNLSLR